MKKIFCALMLFVSSASMSADQWHVTEIKSVYPLSDGAFIVRFEVDHSACTSPEATDYYYVRVGENDVTQEALDKMYVALLSAGMAGKTVEVNFDDSTPYCYINRLLVNF